MEGRPPGDHGAAAARGPTLNPKDLRYGAVPHHAAGAGAPRSARHRAAGEARGAAEGARRGGRRDGYLHGVHPREHRAGSAAGGARGEARGRQQPHRRGRQRPVGVREQLEEGAAPAGRGGRARGAGAVAEAPGRRRGRRRRRDARARHGPQRRGLALRGAAAGRAAPGTPGRRHRGVLPVVRPRRHAAAPPRPLRRPRDGVPRAARERLRCAEHREHHARGPRRQVPAPLDGAGRAVRVPAQPERAPALPLPPPRDGAVAVSGRLRRVHVARRRCGARRALRPAHHGVPRHPAAPLRVDRAQRLSGAGPERWPSTRRGILRQRDLRLS
mmetsp:Transcript_24968/g.78182  ORF Transcript_24968/g.78182 Transcript_24968/m.78182 type:complete len:329 (+) Transcript_24968:278-1264(+)